jgi:hypothetical protein
MASAVPDTYCCGCPPAPGSDGPPAELRGSRLRVRLVETAFSVGAPCPRVTPWATVNAGPVASGLTSLVLMPRRKSLLSQLYRAVRDPGNLEAAAKGPEAYGISTRRACRRTNRDRSRLLRSLGL